jgi:arylsulfatase B
MLAQLDDCVGRVLTQLRETGGEEKTLVVFLSDNGGPTKELTSSNAPLRGGKGELREGGIRVPFIVSWKGTVPPDRTLDVPVLSLDAAVTALDVAGVSPMPRQDGVSLLPLLTGKSEGAVHDAMFWRVGRKNAMRAGDWKLIREGSGTWELYDLARDISETTDLAGKEPERVRALSMLWDKWNAEQKEPLWR